MTTFWIVYVAFAESVAEDAVSPHRKFSACPLLACSAWSSTFCGRSSLLIRMDAASKYHSPAGAFRRYLASHREELVDLLKMWDEDADEWLAPSD